MVKPTAWIRLNTPLWPKRRLNLTTPLHLLLTGMSMVTGVILYREGYTYEGATCVYMLAGVLFAWPYYSARYTWRMTVLVMSSFVPLSIWAQNKAVQSGSWHYRPRDGYLLWITEKGEGWLHWTRHLWLGNDMPAMEYFFYPLFCLFQLMAFSLYSHLLAEKYFVRKRPQLKLAFPILLTVVVGAFVAIYFIFPNPNATDYLYWLAGVGYAITIYSYAVSTRYRNYTQTLAFWYWAGGMGILFMFCWEFFHCCLNRDWIYNRANTFPFFITYRGRGIPLSELLGYLTSATTFKAMLMLLLLRFGPVTIKNRDLIPFCSQSNQPK